MSLFDLVFTEGREKQDKLTEQRIDCFLFSNSYLPATLVSLGGLRSRYLGEDKKTRDFEAELSAMGNIEYGKYPSRLKSLASLHKNELRDHLDKKATATIPPKIHPDLASHIKEERARAVARREAARLGEKERSDRRRVDKMTSAAKTVPELTKEQRSRADDLALEHSEAFYQAHKGMAEARKHITAIRRVDPEHDDLTKWRQEFAQHRNQLQDSTEAIRKDMNQAGLHPAHIEHVLQPNLHGIRPSGKRHMNAVAHFLGGTHDQSGYNFPSGEGGSHFHAWAALHHAERQPQRNTTNTRITFKRKIPQTDDTGLSQKDLIKQYTPDEAERQRRQSLEDLARGHARKEQQLIASDPNRLAHLFKTKGMKHLGKGLHELRLKRAGDDRQGALRVYTDISGDYLHHSDKDDQTRAIKHSHRLLRQRKQQQVECVTGRTLAALVEWASITF